MYRYFLVLFCLLPIALQAQVRIISGRAIDADTEEGLAFANIFCPGAQQGVSTDVDGYYELVLRGAADSLTASAIGYRSVTKTLGPDSVQTINFYLSSSELTLSEVVVIAGENPANAIVRGIIEHKAENRIEGFNSFQYESYAKVELDLENIPERLRNSKLMKPFAFIFDNIDSTSDERPFLPVYLNETVSDVFYVKSEGKPKQVPRAQRTSGIDNQTVIDFIQRIHEDFSIYDDWIYVLEKPFVSPFSNSGLGYYEYYIIDSTFIDGVWSRKLKFKPKRRADNTFYGEFWVADSTFAVQRLSMRMSPNVNINLVSRIIIYQELSRRGEHWLPAKQKMVVDFRPAEEAPGMIGRRTETFRHFRIEQEEINNRYEQSDTYYFDDELERDDSYWEQARHEPLTDNEAAIYQMVDSIQNVPIYKTYVQVLETIFKGYFVTQNGWEFGPYLSVFSVNPVEGSRFRMGFRTNTDFSSSYRFGGYLAYGLRDETFKYGADLQWLIRRRPRTLMGAAFLNDISLNSESSEDFRESDLLTGSLRRDIPMKLIRVTEGKLYYERFWKNGLSNRVTLLHRRMDPYGNLGEENTGFNYAYLTDPGSEADVDTTIKTTELILKTRFAKGEEFIDLGFSRASTGSDQPIIELQYTLGVDGVLESDYTYHKLSLYYRHWFYLNPMGWTSYRFKMGKVFGDVPFLLMEVHPGNEAFFMSRSIFNLINRYEFASDTYASFMVEHHFDGFLLNRVPLLRKLGFRTVLSFKGVIGEISDRNRSANRLNAFRPELAGAQVYSGFRAPNRPYLEAGVGIENILRIVRIDALWRLSYLDNPEASPFGIRAGLAFYF